MFISLKKSLLTVLFCLFALIGLSKSYYFHYDTREIPKGWSLQGLSVSSPINGVSYWFTSNNLPDGFMVMKSIVLPNGNLSWATYYYDEVFGGGWMYDTTDTNAVINNGESVWVFNPGNSLKQVFVGNVEQNSTTQIRKGFNLIAPKTLKTGGISTVHGLSPNNGDMVYKLAGNGWTIHTFEDSDVPQWLPSEPIINPYEGFWYYNSTTNAFNWVQTDYLPNNLNTTERRINISYKYYDPSFPSFYASIMVFATKLNTESMIIFSYAGGYTVPTDPNAWFTFTSYGPGLQPNDENYTAFWASRPITFTNGFIRVSTW